MDLYTIPEAAKATRMSTAWYRKKVLKKEIRFLRIGRKILIPKSTIDEILSRAVVEPSKHSE